MGAQVRHQGALTPPATLPWYRCGPLRQWIQRSGGAAVVVVQTAEHGEGDDLPGLRRLHLWRQGNTLADAPSTALRAGLVRASMVKEAGVLSDHFSQMAFVPEVS
jgi:hypothetical protein